MVNNNSKNMKKNISKVSRKGKITLIILLILITVSGIFIFSFETNKVEALSKYGSRGEEVRQIQTKLKRWGYYNGNVDGIYGSQTQEAVRYFQRKNGLSVDRNRRTKNITSYGNI